MGMATEADLVKAQNNRDIAAAEIKGDSVEVARLKLANAEVDLDIATRKLSVGRVTTGEYEQARLTRDIAAASPILLAAPPTLRFLAWQDAWKTNQPGAARHPDASAVTDAEELGWLRNVSPIVWDVSQLKLEPEPRVLHLWFSHPLFGDDSSAEILLLDELGNVIPRGANGSAMSKATGPTRDNGERGWFVTSFSPDSATNRPSLINLRLSYVIGPLENTQELPVAPKNSVSMSLEGGSVLNGMGQNVDGRAFVSIAANAGEMKSRRFGVVAVTKDGRELTTGGNWSGGPNRTGVRAEEFVFGVPLADVAKFIIGTRPVRTMEWNHAVLPKN